MDSITEYGGYHTFIHNILEKKSCQGWVLEMYSSPQFKAVPRFFTTEWDNKSWYTFPWFICSHFSLQSRKVLPLPISILNESHAELMEAARRASTTWEPASAICQTTVWRMRRAGLCPGCCLMSCVSWGWPTPYQSTDGPGASWLCLWLGLAGWSPCVCPSTATSTSRTRPLLTLWPHSATLPVPVWRTCQCS